MAYPELWLTMTKHQVVLYYGWKHKLFPSMITLLDMKWHVLKIWIRTCVDLIQVEQGQSLTSHHFTISVVFIGSNNVHNKQCSLFVFNLIIISKLINHIPVLKITFVSHVLFHISSKYSEWTVCGHKKIEHVSGINLHTTCIDKIHLHVNSGYRWRSQTGSNFNSTMTALQRIVQNIKCSLLTHLLSMFHTFIKEKKNIHKRWANKMSDVLESIRGWTWSYTFQAIHG